jgi:hypothetical protein
VKEWDAVAVDENTVHTREVALQCATMMGAGRLGWSNETVLMVAEGFAKFLQTGETR